MHVGNFRTAMYAYFFAQKNNGDFILRIEDTDQKRYVRDALEKLIDILKWSGFDYSEGVYVEKGKITQKGQYGPYIQSERLDIYIKYAGELIKNKKAYYCFCAPERLEKMRSRQIAEKKAPMYDGYCLKLSEKEIKQKLESGEKYVVRQKISADGFTEFNDMVRGMLKFENKLLDDQILIKSDGYPTYNFANVVDDYLMEISHVIRGEEFLSSTPKFIQLYDNFGWKKPQFAHLPLILNPDRTKLSKRQGDVSVEDYVDKGYLKEAIINFIAFLGWNPGKGSEKEIFSIEELIKEFDLKNVNKAGAVFDLKKLDWMNAQYIKKLSIGRLYELSKNFFERKEFYQSASEEKKSENYLKKVLEIERERLTKLSEAGESNKFFFKDIQYDKNLLRWKNMTDEEIKNNLKKAVNILESISEENWNRKNLEKTLLEAAGEKKGEFLWPLRVALTGEQKSPPPFEVAWVLGKKESLRRISRHLT